MRQQQDIFSMLHVLIEIIENLFVCLCVCVVLCHIPKCTLFLSYLDARWAFAETPKLPNSHILSHHPHTHINDNVKLDKTFIIYSYIPLWLLKHLWASIRCHKSLDPTNCECESVSVKLLPANAILPYKYDGAFTFTLISILLKLVKMRSN